MENFLHMRLGSLVVSNHFQEVELNGQYRPVDEQVTKPRVAVQTSGEAVYVDDISSPTNCLHGAFIYETKPLVWVDDTKLNPQISGSWSQYTYFL